MEEISASVEAYFLDAFFCSLFCDSFSDLSSASSLDKDLKKEIGYGGNKEAAAKVGKAIAEKAAEKGIKEVCFDRGGYLFHGRVKELADAAREAGLEF